MHFKLNSAVQPITRRSLLGAAAVVAAAPALAQTTAPVCPIGPPPHDKGPRVWMDMDQVELDAAYDQIFYAPLQAQIIRRQASNSELARARLGAPRREAYGPTEPEKLDIHRTARPNAPIFVFIHGGAWLGGEAKNYAYAAEMFVNAGAHFVGTRLRCDRAGGRRPARDGGSGSPRRRLGLQERREFWRRREPALHWRTFLRRASVRGHAGDRLAEGFWLACRHHQGRTLHEWPVTT